MKTATLTLPAQFYFTNKHPIPAREVAESLLALDRVARRVPAVMRSLAGGGGALPQVQLYVEQLQEGSLLEKVAVVLLFKSEKEMEITLLRWRKKFGINLTTSNGVLRTVMTGALLVGVSFAIGNCTATPEKPSIQFSDNTIITIGADELKMTPDELIKIITASVPKKQSLAVDAVTALRPAKRDPQAEIQLDGNPTLVIPSALLSAMPNEVKPEPIEDSTTYEHATLRLRASDGDNPDQGWAAILENDVSAKRIKLRLGVSINPDNLYGLKKVTGKVEVLRRRDAKGQMVVKEYLLHSVDPAE